MQFTFSVHTCTLQDVDVPSWLGPVERAPETVKAFILQKLPMQLLHCGPGIIQRVLPDALESKPIAESKHGGLIGMLSHLQGSEIRLT